MRERINNAIRNNRSFVTYTWVGIFMMILQIISLYLFIDLLKIPTIISSIVIVGGIFIFKFIIYKWTGFTR